MTKSAGSFTHHRYSPATIEEAEIVNVNHAKWTVDVMTRSSSRYVTDIQVASPYLHYKNGEGIFHLPEVGALCYLLWPNDDTSPFVLCYVGAPTTSTSASSDVGSTDSTSTEASARSTVSYRSNRMDLLPGDIAMATRDENFIVLRRGGVLQIGATSVAQRIYIPLMNYIKDFCENYAMHSFGGDITWTVARVEDDPGGDANTTYMFICNSKAQAEKGSVKVSYMPLAEDGGTRKAIEIVVAPDDIDRDEGTYSEAKYTFVVDVTGEVTEVISADLSVTVEGDESRNVTGDQSTSVEGDYSLDCGGSVNLEASSDMLIDGSSVKLGGISARESAVLGDSLLQALSTPGSIVVNGTSGTAQFSPATIAALRACLSSKVKISS